MGMVRWLAGLTLILMTFTLSPAQTLKRRDRPEPSGNPSIKRQGTAVVITGAASRIPQEAALLEHLYNEGWLADVNFISGASSGALNTVMLNGILSEKITWERYRGILLSVTNNQVYRKTGKKLPLDTDPLHQLLTRIVRDSLGYSVIGDLPVASAISATNARLVPLRIRTLRFSNRPINEESNPGYDLVDVLMASTAIPLVFPPVRVRNSVDFPDETFIDGGVEEDGIPYHAVLENIAKTGIEPERMLIISRKRDSVPDIQQELSQIGIKDSKVWERMGVPLNHYSKESFIKKLRELQQLNPGLASRTFVYVPDFKKYYPMLDFNTMREQYEMTAAWANRNPPVPLSEFLRKFEQK